MAKARPTVKEIIARNRIAFTHGSSFMTRDIADITATSLNLLGLTISSTIQQNSGCSI